MIYKLHLISVEWRIIEKHLTWKVLNIISQEGNTNQNASEILAHTYQDGHHQTDGQ